MLAAGTSLGPYKIVTPLGAGGMGEVYLAEDLKHHRQVAIKVLTPETAAAVGSERFLREVEFAAKLTHPHILPVYDSGAAGSLLYFVMPYVEGESLRQRLARERQLPVEDALRIAREVADALSYAHSHGVVHRDIKPENILLQSGHAVVADFGISRAVGQAGGAALTTVGTTVGTPAYMSPEQAAGDRDLDGRSDLYSLGCVLYEMLAGQPPFTGPTSENVIHQHLNAPPPEVTRLRPAASPGVAASLTRALSKAPADRFATAAQFTDALRADERASVSGEAGALLRGGLPGQSDLRSPDAPPQDKTIAVLPFENISPDPENEYFSDGLTEEIIATLSSLRTLKVISRTSIMQYKGTRKPLRQISRELQARFVLEGSVRKHRDDLRITAQLIDAVQDVHLWAERYTGSIGEVFAIQEAVARAIAQALDVTLAGDAGGRRRRQENMEAYQLYLRGRHQWNKWTTEGNQRAIQLFEEALRIDPDYALAYAGIADVHASAMAFESYGLPRREAAAKAREAALRALEIDDELAEAHSALGLVKMALDWEWDAAEREFRRALELNANSSNTYHWYSHLLITLGRMDESLIASRKALELNPIDPEMETHMAFHHLCARQYDAVIDHCRRGMQIDEEFHELHWFIGEALASMGRYGDAIEPLEKCTRLSGGRGLQLASLACAYAGAGQREKAQEILNRLEAPVAGCLPSPFCIAVVHAAMGDRDRAVAWLEKAVDERSSWVTHFNVWPGLDSLHDMPRYRDLLARLGLKVLPIAR